METTIKFFSAGDIQKALSMKDAIRAMAPAFAQLSRNEAVVPLRSQITFMGTENSALFMPVYLPDTGKMALKTVTVFPENIRKNRPTIQALVTLFDAENGQALAVMDGTLLTALRTGAASGLATDLLARKDARILTVFGAGAQGRMQIEAVLSVRAIKKVIIIDPDAQRAKGLAEDVGQQFNVETVISDNPAHVKAADVICTATTSQTPVFRDADLKEGVHINAVGAFRPDMQEIPWETMQRARIIADERRACLSEAGDLLIPISEGRFSAEKIHAEIGELAAGQAEGRENAAQITLFKSVGNGVQDLAAAEIVFQNSLKMNLGQTIRL